MKVLKALDILDRECEAGRRAANRTGKMLIIPPLVCFPLAFVFPLFAVAGAVALIPMIYFFVRARKFARYDTDNRLRSFLLPLLALFKGDLGKDAQVSIAVNMQRLDRDPFKTGVKPCPRVGNTLRGNDYFYQQEWLVMDLRFSDGTALQIRIIDDLRVRKMTKRSISGKTKYKTKRKYKRTFRIAAKFDQAVYQVRSGRSVTAKTEKYLVVKNKVQRLVKSEKEIPDRNVILAGISQAYSQVIPQK
jgi:hypothetical protein